MTFAAHGSGLYGVNYQWQTNGVNIPGATNASLALTNVQASHQATYNVLVSNETGTILSSNATFTLVTPPAIISQAPIPTNQIVIADHTLTLSVVVSAPGASNGFPVSYQWKLNGSNLLGGNASSYTLVGDPPSQGNYSVTVSNVAGSTMAQWQVSLTYAGSYIDTNTFAYHLSTNATTRTNGFADIYNATLVLSNWTYASYTNGNLPLLTNAVWSTSSWLSGMRGLSATCIGFSNGLGSKVLLTMVSPRHYLRAAHVGPTADLIAFLGTNNVLYWRSSLQQVSFDPDTTVGILDDELPSSVGYVPVLAPNFAAYLPTNGSSYVQGIGMNQFMRIFSQPMSFDKPDLQNSFVTWSHINLAPFGLTSDWNVELIGGDSSVPQRFLIGEQLVLAALPYGGGVGPNTAFNAAFINARMHYLSTNNNVGSDYQMTPFSLTNWPTIR